MSDNPSPIRHSGRAGWRMRLSSVLNGGLHDVGLLVPWTILAALLTGGIVAGLGIGIGTALVIVAMIVLVGLALAASLQ
jgi:hypothetical protein